MPLSDIGMTNIVAVLRERGQAASDDEFNGETYWTDEQLEAIAFEAGSVVHKTAYPATVDGLMFQINMPRFLRYSDTGLQVYSPEGTLLDPQPTYTAHLGRLVFASPIEDTKVIVEGFLVDTYEALASLWERKASQRFNYIQFRGGSTANNLNQEYEHCVQMQKFYASKKIKGWRRK